MRPWVLTLEAYTQGMANAPRPTDEGTDERCGELGRKHMTNAGVNQARWALRARRRGRFGAADEGVLGGSDEGVFGATTKAFCIYIYIYIYIYEK